MLPDIACCKHDLALFDIEDIVHTPSQRDRVSSVRSQHSLYSQLDVSDAKYKMGFAQGGSTFGTPVVPLVYNLL